MMKNFKKWYSTVKKWWINRQIDRAATQWGEEIERQMKAEGKSFPPVDRHVDRDAVLKELEEIEREHQEALREARKARRG